MKKKILASLLAVVAIFACIGLTACDTGDKINYSETYEGTLSTASYTTADAAAAAFVANEINSEVSQATFDHYEKTADLTEAEIAQLNLTEAEIADIKSAEIGTIYYIKSTSTASYSVTLDSSVADSNLNSQTIYIVEFNTSSNGGTVKYLAPLPQVGEAVTKSYLESVIDFEAYKNCTQTFEMPMTLKMSQGRQSFTMTINTKLTVRITETAVEMTATATANMAGESRTETIKSYLIDSPYGILQATASGSNYWQVTNYTQETGVEKLADLYMYNLPDVDYSFLVKTSTGFKVRTEYLEQVVSDAFKNADINEYLGADVQTTMSAEYFVSEGRLYSAQVYLKLNGTIDGIYTTITVKGTNKFTNFGKTTVTVPNGAQEALANY